MPTLRPAQADLLRRLGFQDESPASVAMDFQVASNNLTVRLYRARRALRASLDRTCGLYVIHRCATCIYDSFSRLPVRAKIIVSIV